MKRSLVFTLLVAVVSAVMTAQTNKEEVDLYQSIFGMEKKAIVASFVDPEGNLGDSFWSLYDQYETERKALGQKRIDLLERYVQNYNQVTDEKLDALVAEMIKLKSSTDKLMNQYYKKIRKASGAKAATQFFQLENYFSSAIRLSIYDNIPFIGELEK